MRFQLRSQQDIIDFTTGCCFFGTGGGGDPQIGCKMLQEVLNAGKTIDILDAADIAPEIWTASAFLMGSNGPDNTFKQKNLGLHQKTVRNMAYEAARLLQEHAKVQLGAIIPLEIGGASTACAAATAAMLGIPVVDGDYAGGRALPEISQMLPALFGINFSPLMSVDAFDNQVYIQKTANAAIEERLGKLSAGASYSLAGQAGLLKPFAKIKASIYQGSLSRSLLLGKAIRQAAEAGNPMIPNIVEHAKAHFILKGTVTETTAQEIDGYYVGEQTIQGNGDHIKIWFKNEYLQLWKNDEPFIFSPDLICVVDYPSGKPLLNTQVKKGDTVAIFTISAPPELLVPDVLRKLSPRYFDFSFDYKPFQATCQK